MNQNAYGETLLELVNEAIAVGDERFAPGALLENLVALSGGSAVSGPPSSGRVPGAAGLFDAFAYSRDPASRRDLERTFQLIAAPGAPPAAPLEAGDLIVRRGLGEGRVGRIGFIVVPVPEPLERAVAKGWRVETLRPGRYVQVAEPGPWPRLSGDCFARRIIDMYGRLPLDTLVLRIRVPAESSEAPADAYPYEQVSTHCFTPAVAARAPSALRIAHLGQATFDAGTLTIVGRSLAVRGSVFYPAERAGKRTPFHRATTRRGRVPIVFIAHGNHEIFHDPANRMTQSCSNPGGYRTIHNHRGYDYLQTSLACSGIIATSIDCNQTNCSGLSSTNIRQRAGLIVEAIRHFQTLDADASSVFHERIDFDKIGLLGHSRGAEAVLRAAEDVNGGALGSARVRSVISLAPTDVGASNGRPNGFTFMAILPAADGDVVTNDGAKFYDRATPSPFKCQLYIDGANHNFFNKEWVNNEGHGSPILTVAQQTRVLREYGCAFFRQTLLGHRLMSILDGTEVPPGMPSANIHLSTELSGAVTVDDYEDGAIGRNTLGQPVTLTAGLLAQEFEFSMGSPGRFNNSFFGSTRGAVAGNPPARTNGLLRSQLASTTDLTGREVWVRVAQVFESGKTPAARAGFELGLEDAAGNRVFADSDSVGPLPSPFIRSTDDLAAFGVDLTKTMLTTLRFPAGCFQPSGRTFNIRNVRAILIRLNRSDNARLAFDQLQIVSVRGTP